MQVYFTNYWCTQITQDRSHTYAVVQSHEYTNYIGTALCKLGMHAELVILRANLSSCRQYINKHEDAFLFPFPCVMLRPSRVLVGQVNTIARALEPTGKYGTCNRPSVFIRKQHFVPNCICVPENCFSLYNMYSANYLLVLLIRKSDSEQMHRDICRNC